MKIDFKLLHKCFFWSVIGMVIVVAGDLYFEGYSNYSVVILPFAHTPLLYFVARKLNLFSDDTK